MSCRGYHIFLLFSTFFACVSNAQDTLRINLREADSIFLTWNLQLLASSMNVAAQKALVIQSRVYPNPILSAEFNAYDPENNKAFHVGANGQKTFQLEQLILLGGKRKAEIDIAKTNATIAALELEQLLRELKFRLHTDLFAAGYQLQLLQQYDRQTELLNSLLRAYEVQAAKGNIAMKEVVRLKGAYLKLNNDRATLLKEYLETQASLQTLLQSDAVIRFLFSDSEVEKYIQVRTPDELEVEALQSRPDVRILMGNKLLAQQYLNYQKRLAIPDLSLYTNYDQRGGTFVNEANVGISIPLPLWNRNQGNIKSAQFRLREADYRVQAMQASAKTNLQNAFALYTHTVEEYQKAKAMYNEDFETTVHAMTENFQKRNVSIVEFVDFFEAYNEVITEITRITMQLITSGEQLNLLTGKDFY